MKNIWHKEAIKITNNGIIIFLFGKKKIASQKLRYYRYWIDW